MDVCVHVHVHIRVCVVFIPLAPRVTGGREGWGRGVGGGTWRLASASAWRLASASAASRCIRMHVYDTSGVYLNPKSCIHVYVCDRQTRATCTYAPHPVSHHHVYMSHHHISYTSVTDKHVQLAHMRHTLHPTQIQPLHTRLVRDSETLGFRV